MKLSSNKKGERPAPGGRGWGGWGGGGRGAGGKGRSCPIGYLVEITLGKSNFRAREMSNRCLAPSYTYAETIFAMVSAKTTDAKNYKK